MIITLLSMINSINIYINFSVTLFFIYLLYNFTLSTVVYRSSSHVFLMEQIRSFTFNNSYFLVLYMCLVYITIHKLGVSYTI